MRPALPEALPKFCWGDGIERLLGAVVQLIVPLPGEELGRPGLPVLSLFGQDHGPVLGPGGNESAFQCQLS